MNRSGKRTSIATRAITLIIAVSFVFSNIALVAMANDRSEALAASTATAKYTTDLTQLGREGRLRENLNFEAETTRLMKMLGKDSGRQPVLLNDDKASQETIVEQLALRISRGNAPSDLLNKKVIKLETAFLFSTANNPADAMAAVDAVLRGVIASRGQTIIYIDELSNLIASDEAKADLIKGVTRDHAASRGSSGG